MLMTTHHDLIINMFDSFWTIDSAIWNFFGACVLVFWLSFAIHLIIKQDKFTVKDLLQHALGVIFTMYIFLIYIIYFYGN